VIGLTAIEDQDGAPTIAEALVSLFKQVGVQVNYRKIQSNVRAEAVPNGEWEMHVDRPGQAWAVPNVRAREIAPISVENPPWSRGASGVENPLQPFEEEMVKLVNVFAREPDNAKQVEMMKTYQKLHTENVYTIGVVIGRYALGMSKTIKNVPVGCPAFFYQWDYNNFIPEQFWIAKADQSKVPETKPETIADYKKA
jgi:peptide/nickel transport system substrate-binding protein